MSMHGPQIRFAEKLKDLQRVVIRPDYGLGWREAAVVAMNEIPGEWLVITPAIIGWEWARFQLQYNARMQKVTPQLFRKDPAKFLAGKVGVMFDLPPGGTQMYRAVATTLKTIERVWIRPRPGQYSKLRSGDGMWAVLRLGVES